MLENTVRKPIFNVIHVKKWMLKLQPMHGNLKMKPVRRFMSLVICQHIMVKAEHIVSQVICQKNQCCRNCFSMNRTTKIRPQNQSDSDFFRTLFVTQIGHFLTFKQNNLTFSELGIFFSEIGLLSDLAYAIFIYN